MKQALVLLSLVFVPFVTSLRLVTWYSSNDNDDYPTVQVDNFGFGIVQFEVAEPAEKVDLETLRNTALYTYVSVKSTAELLNKIGTAPKLLLDQSHQIRYHKLEEVFPILAAKSSRGLSKWLDTKQDGGLFRECEVFLGNLDVSKIEIVPGSDGKVSSIAYRVRIPNDLVRLHSRIFQTRVALVKVHKSGKYRKVLGISRNVLRDFYIHNYLSFMMLRLNKYIVHEDDHSLMFVFETPFTGDQIQTQLRIVHGETDGEVAYVLMIHSWNATSPNAMQISLHANITLGLSSFGILNEIGDLDGGRFKMTSRLANAGLETPFPLVGDFFTGDAEISATIVDPADIVSNRSAKKTLVAIKFSKIVANTDEIPREPRICEEYLRFNERDASILSQVCTHTFHYQRFMDESISRQRCPVCRTFVTKSNLQ